ncbi:MAG: DoxX family membrane protein [Chloroflexi bacterium]|nr:DoxX family membrane protein [Chloroflexota bacterium]
MTDLLDALRQPHTQLLLRLVLGGLLVFAGAAKLAGRASFREAVAEYQVLPAALQPLFATALPLLEVTLGVLLLLGLGTTVAAAIAVPLFLSFTIAIGVNVARGRHFDCHCFGAARSDEIGWPALLRAAALAVAALTVAAGASRFGALDAALFGATDDLPSNAEVIPIVFLAAVALDALVLLPEALALRGAFARSRGGQIAGRRA